MGFVMGQCSCVLGEIDICWEVDCRDCGTIASGCTGVYWNGPRWPMCKDCAEKRGFEVVILKLDDYPIISEEE